MRYAVIFWGAKRKEKSQKLVTTICIFLSFFLCIMETALLLLHSLNFNERKSWSSFSMQKSLTTSEKLHSFFLFSFPDLKFFYLVYSNNVLFFIEKMGINLLHCVSCLLFTRWRANNIFSIPSHQLSICTSQSQNTFWFNSTMSVECTNPIPILVLAVLTGPFGLI